MNQKFPTETVAVTDYRLLSPTLAKVMVSYTGNVDRQFLHDELGRQFDHQASPVRASFKTVRKGVAVGFVKANRAVRVIENDKQLKASYRVMGSNIMMDNADKSLWEVKEGVAGKYLARHGQEDLTALVQASRTSRPDIPRVNQLTIARAASRELVAFVDADGDVDHGFATQTNDERVRVLSFSRRMPVTVDYQSVVSIYPVEIPKKLHADVTASLSSEQKKQANDYWTRLYSYDPEFLRETIRQVNEGTFA